MSFFPSALKSPTPAILPPPVEGRAAQHVTGVIKSEMGTINEDRMYDRQQF
jgi:hypothetical protein